MKKAIVSLVVISIIGILGFTSYKIVDSIRLKAINAEISASLKNTESADFELSENSGERRENSKEYNESSTENQGEGYSIDLTSAESFLETYNNTNVDYECEEMYYSKIKCMVNYIEADGITIVEIPDTCVYEVKIQGHIKDELGGKINEEEYKIKETNDYTIISLIGGF